MAYRCRECGKEFATEAAVQVHDAGWCELAGGEQGAGDSPGPHRPRGRGAFRSALRRVARGTGRAPQAWVPTRRPKDVDGDRLAAWTEWEQLHSAKRRLDTHDDPR